MNQFTDLDLFSHLPSLCEEFALGFERPTVRVPPMPENDHDAPVTCRVLPRPPRRHRMRHQELPSIPGPRHARRNPPPSPRHTRRAQRTLPPPRPEGLEALILLD